MIPLALQKNYRFCILLVLLMAVVFLTYYYHVIQKTEIVFTHLFYIPISLACIWWKRKGIVVAFLLAIMLLFSHALFNLEIPLINDVIRAMMFVVVASVVALLSEQVEKANILYRTIADSSHTGIYIAQDGQIRYVNPYAERHVGYSAADMEKMQPLTMVHPDDREQTRQNAIRTLKKELSTPYEFKVLDKNGQIRYIMETVTSIDYGGKRAILGNVVDITERKQSEEALRIHHERFAQVLNSLDALVYVTDMQTHELLFINIYGQKIWGDIEGKICWQTIQSGQTGPCAFCTNDRLVGPDGKPTAGIVWEFQNTVNQCWYECRDRAIYWPDGRIVRMEIATDTTERKQTEEVLDRYRNRIKMILESVGDGIYGVDLRGNTIFANPATTRLTGYEIGELIGRNQHAILHHTHADGTPYPIERCRIYATLRDGQIRNVTDEIFWTKKGSSFPVEYVVAPMREHDRITGAVVVFKDIAARKQSETELRMSEERYRTILRDIEDGYQEVDLAGNFTFFNESARRILGYAADELMGINYKHYAADRKQVKKIFSLYNQVYRTGESIQRFDWDIIRKDGERRTVEVSVSLIRNAEDQPEGFRGIVRDITERKQREEATRTLSITDQLTGLYNRRGFLTLAEQQMKSSQRAKRKMMFAFVDIDGMKWINDHLGHEEGDRALIDTAAILRQTFRESDIIARMGGDEFAVLAIDVTTMNPELLSSRLRQIIDIRFLAADRPFKLSMSWGAAMYDPDYPQSLDRLMSEADQLMYAQKKSKKNV